MAEKRRRYFVDRSVQGDILLRIVLYWVLFLFTAGSMLCFIELLIVPPDEALNNLLFRHSPTLVAVLILTPIFLLDLCKLTHRFTGPMVRLRRAMNDLAEGRDVAPLHFRDRDYWQDLAENFNRVAERVQSAEENVAGVNAGSQDTVADEQGVPA
jgi:hypothetical protein